MERDNDIEFDFFEEPAAVEAPPPPRRVPRRGGPRRPVRPAAGFTPLLRLVGLIASAILIVVLLVLWVQGCRSDKKRDSYRHYMADVKTIADASTDDGKQLTTLLTTTGIKRVDAEAKLRNIAQSERLNIANAEKLSPPGPLRAENRHVIEALQLRESGLVGMADTLHKISGTKVLDSDAQLLRDQAQRLIASDILWDDLFKAPASSELEKQEITGAPIPSSTFVTTPDLDSVRTMKAFLLRLQGASTGGKPTGLHGTNIESVKAIPGGEVLQEGASNTIVATTDLGFVVAVKDSGDSQEVGISVTLTIETGGQPIVKTQKIQLIDAGATKLVQFTRVGAVPFAKKVKVKVDVSPVPGESNKGNNSTAYDVIFTLPG
jgi:hypothetical protein